MEWLIVRKFKFSSSTRPRPASMVTTAKGPQNPPLPPDGRLRSRTVKRRSVHQERTVPLVWSHSIDDLDWNELAELYRVAPLGNKNPESLKTAFTNSMFRCLVYEDGKLVGVGRALADGVDCSYLCDIAVLPSHQGTGLGKQIVAKLVDMSRGHKKIILYAVPGKEPFYKKLGFKRMTTAMAIFENQEQALERGYVNET